MDTRKLLAHSAFYMLLAATSVFVAGCDRPSETADLDKPVLQDLCSTLGEDERSEKVSFSVFAGECERASWVMTDSEGTKVSEDEVTPGETCVFVCEGLEPSSEYTVTATASAGDRSEQAVLVLNTLEAEYLTLVDVTHNSYSFRVRSVSETGFYFSSGEYAALDYLLPGWSAESQEDLKEILMMLYPFEGMGDMLIECVDGEQPSWAQIPIEVISGTKYFLIAADKDADGNPVGEVRFLEFETDAQ